MSTDSKLPSSVRANTNSVSQETDLESAERLESIFRLLDRNGNGRIDIQELTGALKGSGMPHQYAEVGRFLFTVIAVST